MSESDEENNLPADYADDVVPFAINLFYTFLEEHDLNENDVEISVIRGENDMPVRNDFQDQFKGKIAFIAHKKEKAFCRLDVDYRENSLQRLSESEDVRESFKQKWRRIWENSVNLAKRRFLHINEDEAGKEPREYIDVKLIKSIFEGHHGQGI